MRLLLTVLLAFHTLSLYAQFNWEYYFSQLIAENQKVPETGVAISLFRSSEVLLQKGWGLADRNQKRAVTKDTLFSLGSTTKAFTALALADLQSRGEVQLQSTIRSVLSDFQLSDEWMTNNVSIEDALSHRSGLPRHDLMWYWSDLSGDEIYERMRFLDFVPQARQQFRQLYNYNNLMYMVAGRVIEEVSGESWERVIRSRLTEPLRMDNTYFSFDQMREQSDYALPYYGEREISFHEIVSIAPAGSIVSSVADMAKWGQLYLRRGMSTLYNRVVSEESIANVWNPRVKMMADQELYYGLGWVVRPHPSGVVWYFHNGNIDGFSAFIMVAPDFDLGLVIFTNQNNSELPGLIAQSLLKKLLKEREEKQVVVQERPHFFWMLPFKQINMSLMGMPQLMIDVIQDEVVGEFEHPAYGKLLFEKEGEQLYLSYYQHRWPVQIVEKYLVAHALIYGVEKVQIPFEMTWVDGKVVKLSAPLESKVAPIGFLRKR